MLNEQIRSYIQESLDAGTSRENVKKNLLAAGWQETDIEDSFPVREMPVATESSPPIPPQSKFSKKAPWIVLASVIVLLGIGIALFFFRSPASQVKTQTINNNVTASTTPTTMTVSIIKPVPVAATCTASNVGLDAASAIYVKGMVTSVDSTGKTQVLTDDCANATYLEKYICYESPVGSGHYTSGRTVVKCPKGCANGACKK